MTPPNCATPNVYTFAKHRTSHACSEYCRRVNCGTEFDTGSDCYSRKYTSSSRTKDPQSDVIDHVPLEGSQ
jgi:hypothetical protein